MVDPVKIPSLVDTLVLLSSFTITIVFIVSFLLIPIPVFPLFICLVHIFPCLAWPRHHGLLKIFFFIHSSSPAFSLYYAVFFPFSVYDLLVDILVVVVVLL